MANEGLNPYSWSNAPGDVYEAHSHIIPSSHASSLGLEIPSRKLTFAGRIPAPTAFGK
jgi:hypothetical protein